jgi:DNA-binding response OmpR family regulator
MQENVLVVEDDDSLLEVLSIGLEVHGFEVVKAASFWRTISYATARPSIC